MPEEIGLLQIPPVVGNVTCYGGNDGYITVEVTGATNPTYVWSKYNETTKVYDEIESARNGRSTLSKLEAGSYQVVISRTDESGQTCEKTFGPEDGLIVTQPNEMTFTVLTEDETGCSDESNGRITVEAIGGTAPYTIRLYGESTETKEVESESGAYTFYNIAGTAVGRMYQVEVIDANGCMAHYDGDDDDNLHSVTIYKPQELLINDLTSGVELGEETGYIEFEITGGVEKSGSYQYRVSIVADAVTITFVVASDGTTASITSSSVAGYTVSATDNTVRVAGMASGEYQVQVVDLNALPSSCSTTDLVYVSRLSVTYTAVQPSCESLSNGSLTLTVEGATGDELGYTWFYNESTYTTLTTIDGSNEVKSPTTGDSHYEDWVAANKLQTLQDMTGSYLPAGYYTVVVKDMLEGELVAQDVLKIRMQYTKKLSVVGALTNERCYGAEDGAITVTVLNNGAPSYANYTYKWTGADVELPSTASISALAPGEYTVTVTDEEGCSVSNSTSFVIEEAEDLDYSLYSPAAVACGDNGTYNRLIKIQALTSNGRDYADPDYTADESPFGGTAPYTFTWSGPSRITKVTSAESGTEVTLTDGNTVTVYEGDATNLSRGGTYNLTITDNNGCSLSNSITIPMEIEVESLEVTDVSCWGGTVTAEMVENGYYDKETSITSDKNGSIKVTLVESSETFSYQWYNNTTDADGNDAIDKNSEAGTTGTTSNEIGGLAAGKYWLHVDAGSCSKDLGPFEVGQPDYPLYMSAEPTDITACRDSETGRITVNITGGTAPYEIYFLDGKDNATYQSQNGYYLFQNLKAAKGIYRLRVTDANGCTYPEDGTFVDVEIKQPGALSIDVQRYQTDLTVDDGGEVDFEITGGVERELTETVLAQLPTTVTVPDEYTTYRYYTVVLTGEGTGTTQRSEMIYSLVKEHEEDGATAVETSTIVFGDDGTIYRNTGETTPISWTGLAPGKYRITVWDYNSDGQCSMEAEFEIVDLEVESEQTNPSCTSNAADGRISVSVTGNTGTLHYTWYYSSSTDLEYVEIDALGAYEITDYADKMTIVNLPVGYYTLIVTDDGTDYEGGKVDGKNYERLDFSLSNSQNITMGTATIKNQSCYGGDYDGAISPVVIAEGDNNLSYSWSGPSGYTSEDQNISGLRPGSYVLTVTDSDGCYVRETYVVESATEIQFNLEVTDNCDVYDRTIRVYYTDENGDEQPGVTGGLTSSVQDYLFDWDGESDVTWDETNYIASNLPEGGVYTLTVRDANMCSVSKSTDELHSAVEIDADVETVLCHGGNNGQIDPQISEGRGNYRYRWYTADPRNDIATNVDPTTVTTGNELTKNEAVVTTRVASQLTAGEYWLIVTDWEKSSYEGCLYNYYQQFEITEPDELNVTATPVSTSCYGGSDGKITVDVTGGTAPYTYQYNVGTSIIETTENKLTGLTAGNYFVIVTDANGCSSQDLAIVENAASLEFTLTVVSDVDCDGKNGQLKVEFDDETVTLGNGSDVTLFWNGPSIAGDNYQDVLEQTGLESGLYSVTVMRNGGCSVSKSHSFVEPMTLGSDVLITDNRCSGSKTGEIEIEVSGGSGSYSYNWTGYNDYECTDEIANSGVNNSNGAYQAGLTNGYYKVVVTDNSRVDPTTGEICTVTNAEPYYVGVEMELVLSKTDGQESCYGANDGQITLKVSGGSGNYSFEWVGTGSGIVQGEQNQSSLSAGDYTVIVTDLNNGCSATAYPKVAGSDRALTLSVSNVTDVVCYGDATGSIDIEALNGTPFTRTVYDEEAGEYVEEEYYEYTWSHLDAPIEELEGNVEGLTAGTYHVSVRDYYGCVLTENIEVTENAQISTSEEITDIVNEGEESGQIYITDISGGKAPYTITWYEGTEVDEDKKVSTTHQYVISNLAAGFYTYTVVDANDCYYEKTVSVNDDGALYVEITKVNDVLCHGAATGRIEVYVRNGLAPYTISVNGGSVIDNYSGGIYALKELTAGIYVVQVTDANGSEQRETFTIEEPDTEFSFVVEQIDESCYGETQGNAKVQFTLKGGTPFDDDTYKVAINTGSAESYTDAATVEGLALNAYLFTATDANGCVVSTYLTLTEYDQITVTEDITHVLCNGETTGAIEVEVSGVTTPKYEWFEGEKADITDDSTPISGETKNRIDNLAAGFYTLRVSEVKTDDRTCSEFFEFEVTEPDVFTVEVQEYSITTCSSDENGQLFISLDGGTKPYTVKYYDILAADKAVTNIVSTNSLMITGLAAGTYVVEATDANGCIHDVIQKEITTPAAFEIVDDESFISCEGSGYIRFTLKGGLVSDGATSYRYTLVGSSAYSGVVVAGTANADGEYVSDVIELTDLAEGTYSLRVEDMNSTSQDKCSIEKQFTLSNLHIYETMHTDPTCEGVNNGTIGITVTGNVGDLEYKWERETDTEDVWETIASTQNLTAMNEGTYRVTVTDTGEGRENCTAQKEFTLTYENTLSITETIRNEQCYGANDGAITNVSVIGALDTDELVYSWVGSGFTSSETDVENLTPGTYTLTVKNETTGCTISKAYDIKGVDAELAITFDDLKLLNCHDSYQQRISLTVAGGTPPYTYKVNGASSNLTLEGESNSEKTLTVDKGGEYTFTVFDANYCETTAQITVPNELTIVGSPINVTCNGAAEGGIEITVSGGSGVYTYAWTSSDDETFSSTEPNLTGLTAGTYKVVVTDTQSSCEVEKEFTITEPEALSIVVAKTDIACYGDNDGSITLTVSGGSKPYTYLWSNGSTTRNQSGLRKGSYTVTVTDYNGCSKTETVLIEEPEPIEFTLALVQDVDCDGTGGALEVTGLTGGYIDLDDLDSYSVVWSGEAITTNEDLNKLSWDGLTSKISGHYMVTVRDLSSNHATCAVTEEYDFLTPVAVDYTVERETCEGQNNGSITLSVSGGSGQYSYEWSTEDGGGLAAGQMNQSGLITGTYTVVVTDLGHKVASTASTESNDTESTEGDTDAGEIESTEEAAEEYCTVTKTIVVGRDYQLAINPSQSDVKCAGGDDGSIRLDVVGGSGDYSYLWTGTCSTLVRDAKDQTQLTRGQYTVTVTDNVYGCELTRNYEVGGADRELEITNITTTDILCKGETTGVITLSVSGGTLPYTYQWSGDNTTFAYTTEDQDDGSVNMTLTGLGAGKYSLTVVDKTGCIVSSGDIEISEPSVKLAAETIEVIDNIEKDGTIGEITIRVVGGVGSYTIKWYQLDDEGNKQTETDANDEEAEVVFKENVTHIDGLTAGNYAVWVGDENGCEAEITFIHVSEPNEALEFNVEKTDILPCYGDNSGKIDVDVYGGTLPYTIVCTSSQGVEIGRADNSSSLNLTGLEPGLYVISVTDALGARADDQTVEITEPAQLTLTKSDVTAVTCYDAETGAFTLTVAGGVNDNAAAYNVVVTGPNGYSEPREITASDTWSSLHAGVYKVVVFDDSNADGSYSYLTDCWIEDTVTIRQPEAYVDLSKVSTASDYYICQGDETELKLIVSNWDLTTKPLTVEIRRESDTGDETFTELVETTPYVFSVAPDETSTYRITKIYEGDDSECGRGTFDSEAEMIEVRQRPTSYIHGDFTVCMGSTVTPTIDLTTQGASPWTLTVSDGEQNFSYSGITETPFEFNYTPEEEKDFTLTVISISDQNCAATETDMMGTATVRVNELPVVSMTGSTTICSGNAATITFTITGGTAPYTVSYYYIDADRNNYEMVTTLVNVTPDEEGVITTTVSPDESRRYYLGNVVDANGCTPLVANDYIEVAVKDLPVQPGEISGPDDVCQGAENITFEVDDIDDMGFEWTLPDGMTVIAGNGSHRIIVKTDRETFEGGMLRVHTTNDCESSKDSEKWISPSYLPVKAGTITSDTKFCQSQTGIIITVDAISYAQTYEWELPSGFSIDYGEGTRNIVVSISETIKSLNGIIKVRGVNSCGEGEWSDELEVEVNPLPTVSAGSDQNICGMETTLAGSAVPDGGTGLWTKVNGGAEFADATSATSSVTNITQGDNTFQWTVTTSDGCSVTDEVVVRNNQLNVTARPIDTFICDGSTEVQGTNLPEGCTGLWTVVEGSGVIENASEANTTISELQQGDTKIRWTITQNGCESSAEIDLTNNQPDDPEVIIRESEGDDGKTVTMEESGYRYVICTDEIWLEGNDVTSDIFSEQYGAWERVTGGGSFDDGTGESRIQHVTGLTQGENIYRYVVSNQGCRKELTVTIYNAMLNINAGLDVATCEETVTLKGTALPNENCVGHWENISEGSKKATFSDAQSNETVVSNMSKGELTFRWIISNEGCVSYDDVVVTNNRTTTATVQADITVCDGETAFTGNAFSTAYETGQWEIVSGYAEIDDVTNPTTKARDFDRGKNVFRWKISSLQGGCVSYADQVVYNNAVDVNAGRDTSVCSTQTQLRAISPLTGGSWSIVPGKGSATIANIESPTTTVGGLSYGDNYFIWNVESSGCTSRDTVIVSNNMPKFVVGANEDQPNTSINGDQSISVADGQTSVTLNGYQPEIGVGTWTLQSGAGTIADVNLYNTTVTDLASGTSTFIWTVENEGCIIDGTVDVVWGEVKTANAGNNVYDLCSDTYTLGANGPYNGIGQWSIVYGTGQFVDSTDPLTKVTGLQKGKNILRWTITYNSGSSSSDVEIWNMSVTEANAGNDRTLCSYEYELQGNEQKVGSYTVEKADGTTEYVVCTQLWTIISGGGNFTDKEGISTQPDTLRNAYVTDLMQGTNTFEYKIYNNYCESSDQVSILNDMADQAVAYVGSEADSIVTCDGTARLYPNTPSYGTGQWTVVSGGQATFDGNDAYNLAQGRNELIWEISTTTSQCTTRDTVVVINNEPTIADAGPDDPLSVCGDQSTLTGNKPTQFTEAYWELREGGGMFLDPEDSVYKERVYLYPDSKYENQTLTVKGLNFGNNRFRWVIKNGTCESTDETVLNNIYIQAVAGAVNPTCADSVRLSANNPSPGIGRWSVLPGYGRASFEDASDYNTMARNLASGENLLLWSVNYLECPSYDTVSVINNKASDAYIEGSSQTLCDTNTTIITASPLAVDATGKWSESGRWEIAEGGGTIVSVNNPTTVVSDVPFNVNGNTYRWVVTRTYGETVCISTAEVMVEYNRMDAYAGEDQLTCDNEAKLEATSSGVATGTWSVTGAASAGVFENLNDPTTKVSNLGLGENILRWTTSYKGCEDYDEVSIINGAPSTPYAGAEQSTCDDVVTLDAHTPETGTGEWSTVSGLASWDETTKYVPNAQVEIGKGDNTFRWTVTNQTPVYRGFDDDGNIVYDTLTCRLYDDVTIHNQNPSDPYAGDTRAICSDEYELKAVTPDYGTGLWTIVNTGGGIIADPTSPQTKVTSLAYGTTRFRWTLSVDGSCAKYDEVEITNFSPTKSDAGPDIEDCNSCNVMDANVPSIGDGRWDVISGSLNDEEGTPSFDNVNDPKTSVCDLLFGENKFLWIIENIVTYDGSTFRCESVDTVSVWNMMPDQADARDDQVRCKDYTTMNAEEPTYGTGTWTLLQGEGTIVEENNPKTMITDLGFGENIFRWTVAFGSCSNEDDVVVYSNTADPYAGENDVTYTDSYQLNAGNPGRLTGYWTNLGSSADISFADSTDYHTMVYGLSQGVNTFRWTIETDDCLVYDEVSITYKVVPEAGFTSDVVDGCSPLTVRFTDESISAKQYSWDFGDGTESTIRNPSHTYQLPGSYKVTLTVPGPDDMESTYSTYITVYSHPEASFTASPQLVYLPDDKVHFMNLSTGAETYLWSFGDGGTSDLKNPTYIYSNEGLYTVTLQVWNEYGCDADTTKEDFIEARRGGFIVFPNTFAPREDVTGNTTIFGVNATFRPVYQDVTTFKMEIYNRWGQLIFETDDINEGWDGRFNGEIAPDGVYVYVVRGRFVSGKEYNKSGNVLLIK